MSDKTKANAADAPADPQYVGDRIGNRTHRSGPDDGAHVPIGTTFRPTPPDDEHLFVKTKSAEWHHAQGDE